VTQPQPLEVSVVGGDLPVIEVDLGAPGPTGPAGPTGAGLTIDVPVASATWTLAHGLGANPNVTTVDTTGRMIEGDVSYPDPDTAVVEFTAAVAGSAYIS
jgi:hypothetical protein